MKYKIFVIMVLAIVVFISGISLVEGAGDLGCCIQKTVDFEGGKYCQPLDVTSRSECKSGMWDHSDGAVIEGTDGLKCSPYVSGGSVDSGCVRGCSITNEIGDGGVLKIRHVDEEGDKFEEGSCPAKYVRGEFSCIINGVECKTVGSIGQCSRIGILSDKDKGECAEFTLDHRKDNLGCCSSVNGCFYTSGDRCDDIFSQGVYCVDVGVDRDSDIGFLCIRIWM